MIERHHAVNFRPRQIEPGRDQRHGVGGDVAELILHGHTHEPTIAWAGETGRVR